STRLVSIIPVAVVAACAILTCFVALERAKERTGHDPLFAFGLLRTKSFGYGLLTLLLLAMGQMGFVFLLSVLLQDGRHLSAVDTGLSILPSGISIFIGAQTGARLTRRINTTDVVRAGLALEAVGLLVMTLAVSPDVTFFGLLPGVVIFGIGFG